MKKILVIVPIILIAAAAGLYFYANLETENQLDIYIERAIASGSYKAIQYESADFGVDGTITITGLNVTDASDFNYVIDQVQLSDMDFLNPFPRSIAIRASGFSFPQGAPDIETPLMGPELENFMGMLNGSQSVPIELEYAHQYDPRNNDQYNSAINVGMPDSFSFSLTTETRHIPYETLSLITDPAAAESAYAAALLTAEIPALSISLTDLGLLNGLLEAQAREQGRSTDAIRNDLMAMTQSLFLFAPPDLQALAIDLGNELSLFLEGNKTFNLALRPDMSGSVQQLQAPVMGAFFNGDYAQIVDLMNLEFSTR